jgi:hypothetical protein
MASSDYSPNSPQRKNHYNANDYERIARTPEATADDRELSCPRCRGRCLWHGKTAAYDCTRCCRGWAVIPELPGVAGGGHQYVPSADVVLWLLKPPQEPKWICVARFLRRERDAAILENPAKLGAVMATVLSGFRPIWEQTEVMAHAL